MVAQVIINSNVKVLNKTFDYKIPDKFKDRVFVGTKVKVPFGKQKDGIEGYIISLKEKSDYECKEIIDVLDEISTFNLLLAKWMAKKYFCNISDCIKLMQSPSSKDKNYSQRIKEKYEDIVFLSGEFSKENNYNLDDIFSKFNIKGNKQKELIDFFFKKEINTRMSISELISKYSFSRSTIDSLIEKNILLKDKNEILRDPLQSKEIPKDVKNILTSEQKYAFDRIDDSICDNYFQEFLIHGITGSGKTEIYLQLIKQVLKKGKKALVLVPEISLTPQMINRFIARFSKDEIAIMHSKLSLGQKLDMWNKIKNDKAKIIIGARSALFSPFDNLGIIIIDEEHDSSYISDSMPKYDSREVARKIANYYKIPLVLGSATPDIITYNRAKNNETELLELKNRANNSSLPETIIVDMKQELIESNHSYISNRLKNEIEKNIAQKKQTILYLNRRGFDTLIICKSCGEVLKCPNCSINLTYHKSSKTYKCHYCSYEIDHLPNCKMCGNSNVELKGIGTQKLEEQVKELFPNCSTIRMDIDTTSNKDGHEQIINKFLNENIDILIGTQMVVKGHHFPNVTLVGIINADSNLNNSDYRAYERTFQILTQVSGRAGREKEKGKVIIQSYNPENLAIDCAKNADYANLYDCEIKSRSLLNYPPFCNIIVVNINGLNLENVKFYSNNIYEFLENTISKYKEKNILDNEYKIFKPSPAPIEFIKNRYRYRIIIKTIVDEKMNNLLNNCLKIIYSNIKDKNIRVSFDLDPANMN